MTNDRDKLGRIYDRTTKSYYASGRTFTKAEYDIFASTASNHILGNHLEFHPVWEVAYNAA